MALRQRGPRRHITRGLMGPRQFKEKNPLCLLKIETLFLGPAGHILFTTPTASTSQSRNLSADTSMTASKTSYPRSVV